MVKQEPPALAEAPGGGAEEAEGAGAAEWGQEAPDVAPSLRARTTGVTWNFSREFLLQRAGLWCAAANEGGLADAADAAAAAPARRGGDSERAESAVFPH